MSEAPKEPDNSILAIGIAIAVALQKRRSS
jgi:hypothetical protein